MTKVLAMALAFVATAAAQPDTLWTRTYGTRYSDVAYCVLPDMEGGCAVFGTLGTRYTAWPSRFLLYDSAGTLAQEVNLVGRVYCACPAPGGGFFIAGSKPSSRCSTAMMVCRLSREGVVSWTREFGPSGPWYSRAAAVCATPEGGCVAVGMKQAFAGGGEGLLAARVDAGGNVEWERDYVGFWVYGGTRTTADEYLAVGARVAGGGAVLVRISPSGDTIGTVSPGGSYSETVCPTVDGGCVVSSYSSGVRLTRLDSTFSVTWDRDYRTDAYCSDIQPMPDGGFLLVGGDGNTQSGYDLLVARLDERGEELWARSCGGDSSDAGKGVCLMPDSGYVAAGHTRSRGEGESDFWVLRLEPDTVGIAEPDGGLTMPRSGLPTVTLAPDLVRAEGRVFDLLGREVTDRRKRLAPGVYFVRQAGSDGPMVQRVVIAR